MKYLLLANGRTGNQIGSEIVPTFSANLEPACRGPVPTAVAMLLRWIFPASLKIGSNFPIWNQE
jgi:hypothetical protein